MVRSKLPLTLVVLSFVLLAFGVGYITYPLLHPHPELPAAESVDRAPAVDGDTTDEALGSDIPDMVLFWEVWHLLARDFYGEQPEDATKRYGAIRGMVASFEDPYTYFVEPQPRELEQDALRGSFGGIGAYIERSEEGFRLNPMAGQPADLAGILAGDLLLQVDEHEIDLDMTDDDVIALVRGPLGTEVLLALLRTGEGQAPSQLTIPVTRAEIQTPSVEWRMLDDQTRTEQIGYIRQTLFTERSVQEMRQALAELTASGAQQLILDLRGNPGGLLDAAVEIADMWLADGLILVEENADGKRTDYYAEEGGEAVDLPVIVLVDGASASASEIVAGALQDSGRARLVGEKTFGKGSVQLIHQLSDESSLHVTSAEWFTPNGHALTGQGLTPDMPVEPGVDPLPVAVDLLIGSPVVDASQGIDGTE